MAFRVVSFNVNSIRARAHQLQAVIERHAPHLIGLQETKVADDAFPHEELADTGYDFVVHGQPTHYGVAVAAPKALSHARVTTGLPDDSEDAQRRFIAVDSTLPDGSPVTLVNGYFPQGESRTHPTKFPGKRAFYADVLAWLRDSCDPAQNVIVMGDMNVAPIDDDIGIGDANRKRWLRDGKTSFLPEEREWLEALQAWGLVDSYLACGAPEDDGDRGRLSWFDYRSRGFERDPRRGLRIDLILVSEPLRERLTDAGIDYAVRAMERPSDHCPIWAQFD